MRKRIAIAVVAVLVIGVGAYLISALLGPQHGSVEWHKRGYLDALAMPGNWHWYAPEFVKDRYFLRRAERWMLHREALLQMGYLTNREFVVSGSPGGVEGNVFRRLTDLGSNYWEFVWFGARGDSNAVTVSAPVAVMSQLEKMIREADVP